jgi:hypothetical protein
MNKCLVLIFAIVLLGCNSDKKDELTKADEFHFKYTLDTLQVDSKGEFFFLNNGLGGSTVTPSGLLYTFNRPLMRMDVIDLAKGELKDIISLEEEGPNGIGGLGINTIQISDSGNFYFSSFTGFRQFGPNGELKNWFNWDTEPNIQDQVKDKELISFDGIIAPNGSTFYGTYSSEGRSGSSMADGLAIIDLNSLELKTVEVPSLASLKEFRIELEIDGMKTVASDNFHLLLNDNKLIVTQSSVNSITVYDLQKDSLQNFQYQTEFLPAKKPGNYQRRVSSMESFEEASKERSKEPLFGEILFDSKNELYYRVSFLKEQKPDGAIGWNGVISVFDLDFKLIHEEDGLGRYTGKKFIKEGKMYRFINLDDELAFEVLTPIIEK